MSPHKSHQWQHEISAWNTARPKRQRHVSTCHMACFSPFHCLSNSFQIAFLKITWPCQGVEHPPFSRNRILYYILVSVFCMTRQNVAGKGSKKVATKAGDDRGRRFLSSGHWQSCANSTPAFKMHFCIAGFPRPPPS